MVMSVEPPDSEGGEVKVRSTLLSLCQHDPILSLSLVKLRVLFTHPLYAAMKPCPFFMDGGCKFSEEDCKFSHGMVVAVDQLQHYEEHDFR